MPRIHPCTDFATCAICFEESHVKYMHKLNCKHIFHKKCIYKWFEKDNLYDMYGQHSNIEIDGTCPVCRKKQTSIIFGKWTKCKIM